MKKKIANGKRTKKTSAQDSAQEKSSVTEAGVDETTLKHLEMVMSSIEGRKVSRQEVVELLREMRQQGMAKREEPVYPAKDPDEKPG